MCLSGIFHSHFSTLLFVLLSLCLIRLLLFSRTQRVTCTRYPPVRWSWTEKTLYSVPWRSEKIYSIILSYRRKETSNANAENILKIYSAFSWGPSLVGNFEPSWRWTICFSSDTHARTRNMTVKNSFCLPRLFRLDLCGARTELDNCHSKPCAQERNFQ